MAAIEHVKRLISTKRTTVWCRRLFRRCWHKKTYPSEKCRLARAIVFGTQYYVVVSKLPAAARVSWKSKESILIEAFLVLVLRLPRFLPCPIGLPPTQALGKAKDYWSDPKSGWLLPNWKYRNYDAKHAQQFLKHGTHNSPWYLMWNTMIHLFPKCVPFV